MAETKPYTGLLGLDQLPRKVKIAIWCLTFVITAGWSIHLGQYDPFYYLLLEPTKFPRIFLLICIVSVCLRLAGIHWPYIVVFIASILLFLAMLFFFGFFYYSLPYLD